MIWKTQIAMSLHFSDSNCYESSLLRLKLLWVFASKTQIAMSLRFSDSNCYESSLQRLKLLWVFASQTQIAMSLRFRDSNCNWVFDNYLRDEDSKIIKNKFDFDRRLRRRHVIDFTVTKTHEKKRVFTSLIYIYNKHIHIYTCIYKHIYTYIFICIYTYNI